MRVRFLDAYQGKLTGERFFAAGAEADIEDLAAQRLVAGGWATIVPPPPDSQSAAVEAKAVGGEVETQDGASPHSAPPEKGKKK